MAAIPVSAPTVPRQGQDQSHKLAAYGHARLPASAHDTAPQRVDKIPYGCFRNVYLYITEACPTAGPTAAASCTASYTYTLYGTDDQLHTGNIDVAALRPRMVRTESVGDFYTLHHTMIHSATAQPYTTSLIIRGPAAKDRFLVTDRTTGQAWWQHGAATESPDEAARKQMNAAHANDCIRQLTELRVLN